MSLPDRSTFISELLAAVFPGQSNTGYVARATQGRKAAIAYGLVGAEFTDIAIEPDGDFFAYAHSLADYAKQLTGKVPALMEENGASAVLSQAKLQFLYKLCERNGSLDDWLSEGGRHQIIGWFAPALFYGFLLSKQPECAETAESFVSLCLDYLGISLPAELAAPKNKAEEWARCPVPFARSTYSALPLHELAEVGIVAAARIIGTCIFLLGKDEAVCGRAVSVLQASLNSLAAEGNDYSAEVKEIFSIERASQTALLRCVKRFEPRSINTLNDDLKLEKIFVAPRFSSDSPAKCINSAGQSYRTVVIGKTGLGKSIYLQMLTRCILAERFGTEGERTAVSGISELLSAPKDMVVISIPARMFSYFFRDPQGIGLQERTEDFTRLFFSCMLQFSNQHNFYSSEEILDVASTAEDEPTLPRAFTNYLKQLAEAGKLLLLLDSFDEIPAGEMRQHYLKAIRAFRDTYCIRGKGAHVIMCTRQMSESTLKSLISALSISYRSPVDCKTILELGEEDCRQLVHNWIFYGYRSSEITEAEMLSYIRRNHFYSDYATNPYMLSVLCNSFDAGPESIAARLIDYLVHRMQSSAFDYPDEISEVIDNVESIFRELAAATVEKSDPYVSSQLLNREINSYLDKSELSAEDIVERQQLVNEIIVSQAGLLIPADGRDNGYQFINNQIRYELAARYAIASHYASHDDSVWKRLFGGIHSVEEYTGLIVPLVCKLGNEDIITASDIVLDLCLKSFDPLDGNDPQSTQATLVLAMADLVLGRYGPSIATLSNPGRLRVYVERAQRLLILRLITAPEFAEDRACLKGTAAYKAAKSWLSNYTSIP